MGSREDNSVCVSVKYVDVIKDMYTKTCYGTSSAFSITIGLYQGSSLSPYIFVLVMDEVKKKEQLG